MTKETFICPFCSIDSSRLLVERDTTAAFFDGYPVSEGHTLVVPRRHVASIFELSPNERVSLWTEVEKVRTILSNKFVCDGFNIGLNDGEAAGQIIGHAHIHVIPRRKGDSPDPRGGVRWIFPDKAKYW